jgi:hypothetical protein
MELIAVYRSYKLGREGNGFNKDYKLKVERDPHLCEIEYAEGVNHHSKINGLWYEKDERLSKIHYSGGDFTLHLEDVEEESKEDLVAKYEELSGEKAKPIWGVKKLTEEIAKLSNEKK